jgi:hypothetical protein
MAFDKLGGIQSGGIVTGTPQPIWVWIDPTDRCNLKCRDCYTKAAHNVNNLSPADFDVILSKLRVSEMIDVRKFT